MPMLIEHIDAIARKKQRDVLYVTFHPQKTSNTDPWDRSSYEWEQDPIRETVCKWLTEHHIDCQPCGNIANVHSMCSYRGQIYLDVPFDENDPLYALVRDYLENPDGSMRFETVIFGIYHWKKPWKMLITMNQAFGKNGLKIFNI